MPEKFIIKQLAKEHDRSLFDCGIEQLNDFLKTKSIQQAKKGLGVTYVFLENNSQDILGYYTLSATSIPLDLLPDHIAKKLPRYQSLPATLLGRLAIDKSHQGKKFGNILLYHALETSLEHSKSIGSMAVAVDAINKAAVSFYKKHGFINFLDCEDKLFLPMRTVKQLVED